MKLHGKIGMMIIMASILFLLVGCGPAAGSEVEEAHESTEVEVEVEEATEVAPDDEEEPEVDEEEPIEEPEPEEQEEPEEESPATEVASTESTTPATTQETKPAETKPAETKPAETKPAEETKPAAPAETPPAAPAETPAATGFKDGSFTGSGQGYDGGITRVRVNVSGGKIQAIEVTAHDDTPAIAEGAFTKLTQSIISAQSADVDTVSGATFSSRGLIQAVKSALQ